MIFLAAREAAHQRLFAHVPWLQGAAARRGRAVRARHPGGHARASRSWPAASTRRNPAAIEEAMQSGMFEPQTTPEQKAALARLETLLALSRAGWTRSSPTRWATGCPGRARCARRCAAAAASGGPAEQTFATVVGLELRPRRLRAAAELWRLLTEQRGVEGRDALWAHPDLMPTADDLDDPAAFVGARRRQRPDRRAGEAGRARRRRRSSPATRRTTATSSRRWT